MRRRLRRRLRRAARTGRRRSLMHRTVFIISTSPGNVGYPKQRNQPHRAIVGVYHQQSSQENTRIARATQPVSAVCDRIQPDSDEAWLRMAQEISPLTTMGGGGSWLLFIHDLGKQRYSTRNGLSCFGGLRRLLFVARHVVVRGRTRCSAAVCREKGGWITAAPQAGGSNDSAIEHDKRTRSTGPTHVAHCPRPLPRWWRARRASATSGLSAIRGLVIALVVERQHVGMAGPIPL